MRAPVLVFSTVLGLSLICFATTACRDNAMPKQAPIGTFSMGERAQVGPLIYTVFESKWELSFGEQPTPRIPTNRFYIINVSAVNTSSTPVSIPTFTLVDDDDKSYQELENGQGVPNWLGFIRRVQPADSTQGPIVFDVPQKRYRLRIADEAEDFAYVTIPLSLGDSLPAVAPAKR
jgi:hypothetical protein